jgi:CRISPR/Cas system-associated exonuclease Cas4 (RecB family)
LRKLTRGEFFSRLQLIRTVDPLTNEAYKESEKRAWENQEGDSPHGNPWHVSFHASQFPGDDPMACPRQALYRMMDFPAAKPFPRRSRAIMSAGKAIEEELVRTYERAGILLSAPVDEEVQTGFEVPDAWLTGSVDSVLLPKGWNKPLPVEIKSKYQEIIDEMKLGKRGPDPGHVFQLKVQLALVKLDAHRLWPHLDPVTHGYIYYVSRNRPDDTAEFRVDLDEKFFRVGVERLKQWKAWFQEDFLPSENPSKRHPMGWRWSYPPCQWCDFKKTCQLDHESKRDSLSESIGVDRARMVRPNYDPESAKLRVLARWQRDKSDNIAALGNTESGTEGGRNKAA